MSLFCCRKQTVRTAYADFVKTCAEIPRESVPDEMFDAYQSASVKSLDVGSMNIASQVSVPSDSSSPSSSSSSAAKLHGKLHKQIHSVQHHHGKKHFSSRIASIAGSRDVLMRAVGACIALCQVLSP